jgi:hypothetical protein
MSVITPSSFDISKLTATVPKKLDNGSFQVYLNYNGGKLRVQAPRMPMPYNSGDYQGNQKYKAQFSFSNMDSNPKVRAYYDMLEAIDEFVLTQASKNATTWIGPKAKPGCHIDTLKPLFTGSVKLSTKDYPPTSSVALKLRNGGFDAELYDDKKRLMEGVKPTEVLKKGTEVTAIVESTGVWIAAGRFGVAWKLVQARIDLAADGPSRGCAILDDDEEGVVVSGGAGVSAMEEDAELLAAVLPAETATETVDDEEQEEEQPEEDVEEDEVVQPVPMPTKKAAPAPAPAPAPAVRRTVGAKKTAVAK